MGPTDDADPNAVVNGPVPGDGDATGPEPDEETDRTVLAVDREEPPRLPFTVVGMGASAGGVEAFVAFFDAVAADTGMAFVLVQHLPPTHESLMAEILAKHTRMPVRQVEDGMPVRPNHVYVIRPGNTLTIRLGKLHLGEPLEKRGHQRPVDDFFRSLAEEQRERSVCVILSGMGSNGSAGAQMVKAVGGVGVAQDPEEAKFPSMPRAMIDAGYADYVLRAADMPEVLARFANHAYAKGDPHADPLARRDQKHLSDLLAILRTRTRHDFSGYKKPTLVRRVQRRMGLNGVGQMGDYVRLLRQTPAEASGLVDDLLIHVTGFFRDPEVWEAVRAKVIAPLVAAKADNAAIRCWVTACSSGEEAYTLGMLLLEAAEAAGKSFDIKVFATDMADRALAHARAGIYPGGIETEVSPERLDRFFERDQANYRVRRPLRELVVFAPQNVLQDPPFGRMDVCSCRNLLIYLEPDVQRRVLGLLHFALIDGGVLLLGTSETTGGDDRLFEPIDKRARLFRRVGPTRHGQLDFPAPTGSALSTLLNDNGVPRTTDRDRADPPRVVRATVAQLTQRALLERFTPPSIVVDRQFRIVYFHGNTEPFLDQPRGEPTRDLLALARESVRGPIRLALHAAIERQEPQAVRDGVVQTPAGPQRVMVRATPLEPGPNNSLFLVSFDESPEPAAAPAGPRSKAGDRQLREELARTRVDLQATIQALQATNEEMKAANEEITSVNEELQSTNEELETSKEELQSLNEELTTVNAQLQVKIEESLAIATDLSSLLSSTDLAVIFLDTRFRIRRFTPAVAGLMDMISTDVGRPLKDLARKFHDPDLMADAGAVLEKLVPAEQEVPSDAGRWYVRRITHYRTDDDRIDGVVITFVDVTERRQAEAALRHSEGRYRALVNASAYAVYRMSPDWREMRVLDGRGFLQDVAEPTRTWLEAFIPAADQPRVTAAIEVAIRTRGVFRLDHRVHQADGSVGWTSSRAVPVLDEQGAVVEWFGAASDVTTHWRATEAQARSERRLRTVTDLVPDLLWQADGGGRINWSNARWQEYTGQTAAEAVAWRGWLDAVHPDERPHAAELADAAVGAGGTLRHECRLRRADGRHRWFVVQAVPVRGDDGLIRAWYGAATDVDDQRALVRSTGEQAERIRLAVQATRMGFWEWLVDADVIRADPENNRIMGVPADTPQGSFRTYANRIHPDDRERVMAALAGAVTSRDDLHLEFRVVHPDGAVRWVAKSAHPMFAAAGGGRADRVLGTALDVTERKAAELSLDQQLAAEQAGRHSAEAASEAKDQFLANVSHELRTPLSAILLWAKVLRNPDAAERQKREGMDAIARAAESQRELIEDLLDTSRISSGKLRLDVRTFDLGRAVREAADNLRPAADARRVTLAVDVAAGIGFVNADPDRLQQVLWNLLSNAVKFTPADGRVSLTARREADDVEVTVTDTGRGIAPALLPHVFERFWQAKSSARNSKAGLGLGLAIAKQLVELHGGTLDAQSEGEGKGASFRCRLPLPTRERAARAARPAGPQPTLGDVRVLLVEDDEATRNALTALLQGAGATVAPVGSVADAWAAYEADRPDLILSDIGLPDGYGYDLIRRIRTHEADRKAATTPALALTALVRRQDRRRSAESGFQHHLAKPVDPDQLIRALTSMIER